MIKQIKLILIAFCFSISLIAENPCAIMFPVTDTSTWGVGFIRIKSDRISSIKGLIASSSETCYISDWELRYNNQKKNIDSKDFVPIGFHADILLKVFAVSDTKYKVCENSIKGGIWLDFDDFTIKGFKFDTYYSLISHSKSNYSAYGKGNFGHWNVGVNFSYDCLKLMSEPNTSSAVVSCLKCNNRADFGKITHIEILSVSNGWANVIAREYKRMDFDGVSDDGNGCNFKVENEYLGYIKVLDDFGRPNMWYARL